MRGKRGPIGKYSKITTSFPSKTINKIDDLIKDGIYLSRTGFVRIAVQEFLRRKTRSLNKAEDLLDKSWEALKDDSKSIDCLRQSLREIIDYLLERKEEFP